MNLETIQVAQQQKLHQLVQHVYANSTYWKTIMDTRNIHPTTFVVEDLEKFPVITKENLQKHLSDMICVSKSEIIDYVCTSGTTASPINIPLTNTDLDRLAENEYQSMLLTGATKDDIFQICTTIDKQFMAGLAYFLGIRKLGAGIIRQGIGAVKTHWNTIESLQPTYLIAVPSFVVKLINYAIENGIDYQNSSVKKIICIGENIRKEDFSLNAVGQKIADSWNVRLFSTYASSEMATAFTECEHGNGGHHNEDLLSIELLDQQNNPVKPGEIGELTITTLGMEAFPLIRYKTGDLCTLHYEPCACGIHTARISPILGRTAQRIKYKGTTFYPSAIFEVLHQFDAIKDHAIVLETNNYDSDDVHIHIALQDTTLITSIKEAVKTTIRVLPTITIHDSLVMLRKKHNVAHKRKLSKVIDLRAKT
ncbi:phenylacetate--CoA ligase family protein [Kordia antarctica]|nr:AMP-binding protein [Kordia antarctica]